jgi:hypothetical protein
MVVQCIAIGQGGQYAFARILIDRFNRRLNLEEEPWKERRGMEEGEWKIETERLRIEGF